MTTRTRTKGTPLVATSTVTVNSLYSSCSETSWTVKGTYNGPKVGNFTTMTDVVTKGFAKRSALGDVIMSPMSSVNTQSYTAGGQGHHIRAQNWSCSPQVKTEWRYDGDYFGLTVFSNGFPAIAVLSAAEIAQLEREATSRCLNSRGRGDSGANLFETWAEKEKAFAMLKNGILACNPNRVLSKSARSATISRLGRTVRSPKKLARIAADDWLMYRYGIQPLLNDIKVISAALRTPLSQEASRVSSRGKAEAYKTSTDTLSSSTNAQTTTYVRESVHQCVVRAVSLDEVVVDKLLESGISFKGLITLPWELVPYSFVADWFTNIGDIIGSATPAPGWKQLGSCLTVTQTIRSDYLVTGCTPAAGYDLVRPVMGGGTGITISKVRKDLAPDWYIPVIRANFKLSEPKRAADAAALVGQLILRRFGVK